jgi:hypothetical protein
VRRAIGEKTERARKHRERGSNDNDDYERRRATTHEDASFVVEVLETTHVLIQVPSGPKKQEGKGTSKTYSRSSF